MDTERYIDEKEKNKQKNKDITHRKAGTTGGGGSTQDYTKLILSSVGNSAISNLAGGGVIQPKLKIDRPGDFYEKQADNAAEQVTKSSSDSAPPHITPLPSQNSSGLKVSKETENGVKSLKGKGTPINRDVRDYFQPRFGTDLGSVRVHTDNNANKLAESVNARAFTHGNDIVFAKGEFQPGSQEGKKLIAHELAHVQQQGSGSSIVSRKPKEGKGSKDGKGKQAENKKQAQKQKTPPPGKPPKKDALALVAIAGEKVGQFLNFLSKRLVKGSIASLEDKIDGLQGKTGKEEVALAATYKQRLKELEGISDQITAKPITIEDVDNAFKAAYAKVQAEKSIKLPPPNLKMLDQETQEKENKKTLDSGLDYGLDILKGAWEELKPLASKNILSPAEEYGKRVFWEFLTTGNKATLITAGSLVIIGLEALTAHIASDYENKLKSGYFDKERNFIEGIVAKMPSLVGKAKNGLEKLVSIDIPVGDHVKITPKLGGNNENETGLGTKVTVGNEKVSGSVEAGTTYNYSQVGKGAKSWGPWLKTELHLKNIKLSDNTTLKAGLSGDYSEKVVLDPSTKEGEVKSTIEQHILNGAFSVGTITRLGSGGGERPTLSTNLSAGLKRDLMKNLNTYSLSSNIILDFKNKRKVGLTYEGQFGDQTKNSASIFGEYKNLRIKGTIDAVNKNVTCTASLVWQLRF